VIERYTFVLNRKKGIKERTLLFSATCIPTKFDEVRNHLPYMSKVVIKKTCEG